MIKDFSDTIPLVLDVKSTKQKKKYTVELHLSGLIGTTGHLDMQKFRIIGFLFENTLYWQF